MRVGILGGSFDPIHHGHLIAAQVLREQLSLDQVRLIPTGQQPFKSAGHHASSAHRAAMVARAVEGLPGLAMDPIEVERQGPSWTVDTLRLLSAREPGTAWVLLIGSDNLDHLPKWREYEVLTELAELVPFNRGTPSAGERGEVTAPVIAISSTAVRARVRAGLSIRYWVPDAVADYVDTHRLYRDGIT